MAYRKRRRARNYWLPAYGVATVEGDETTIVGGIVTGEFPIQGGGQPFTIVAPVTTDQPVDETSPVAGSNATMADIIGSGYMLRRIVGKCYCGLQQRAIEGQVVPPPGALIAAGFFVARAEQQNPNEPVGFAIDPTQYSVLNAENTREPWIWRRSWLLGNESWTDGQATSSNIVAGFPPNNCAFYGAGLFDGPHLDARTARRVTSDDRLYFAVSGVQWPPQLQLDSDILFHVTCEFRLLGHLARQGRKGTF